MKLAAATTIAQVPGCLAAKVGEDVVIMSVKKGVYLSLDPIGHDIWNRIASPCRFDDLCTGLLEQYDATPDTIAADIAELIQGLAEAGAVEIRTTEPGA